MYKLIRFYNQNRGQIIKIILIIVFIIGIIQALNYFTKSEKKVSENIINKVNENYINNNDKELISNKSAISGQVISSSITDKDLLIIKEFINYCNQKEIYKAYDVLSEECKEEMYPTVQDFYNIYYSEIFNEGNISYIVENWSGHTYQVNYAKDILSTGNISSGYSRQDYITIIDKNKININNYIGRTNRNKITENKDIKVIVKDINTYMDYEIYNLTIENNSKNAILLDTSDDTKSVYLLDNKNMKYYFYNNEVIQSKLLIQSGFKSTFKIKFSNSYSFSKNITKLVFSKLILNYDDYKYLENKEEYEDFFEFRINV